MHALYRMTPASLLLLTFACDADPSRSEDDLDVPTQEAELTDDADEIPDRTPEGAALAAPRDPSAATADCCTTGGSACSDLVVSECVCEVDPYCCNVAWDSICVSEVDSLGCGTCAEEIACCESSPLPGCEDSSTASCVCDADPYCCGNQWDATCVSLVESLGCGSCDPLDLVITENTMPTQACVGQDIRSLVALDVTNDSNASIDGTVGVAWYLSDDPFWGTGDTLLLGGRGEIVGGMAGGEVASLGSLSVNRIPWGATPGPQYLLAVADELDVVSERDELNNVLARPIEVTPACSSSKSWLKRLAGSGHEFSWGNEVRLGRRDSVDTDSQGNIYLMGTTNGATIDWGWGPQPIGADDHDLAAFIVSYDVEGNYRWSRVFSSGEGEIDEAFGVAVDAADQVYVLVSSTGPLDMGTGTTPPVGTRDVLVASYDPNGTPKWTNRYGAAGARLEGADLAVSKAGETAVAVHTRGNAPAVDFGGGAPSLPEPTEWSAVFSLDNTGAHRFTRRLNGSGNDKVSTVDINAAGEVLVVGRFLGFADYGTGLLGSEDSQWSYVLYLDPAGNSKWAKVGVGAANGILDPSGTAYVAGRVDHDINSTPTSMIAAYDSSGTPLWYREEPGSGSGDGLTTRGLAINSANELVFLTSFYDADPTATASYADRDLPRLNNQTFVLAGYRTEDGVGLWGESFGGSEELIENEVGSIAASPAGNVVVVGNFMHSLSAQGSSLTGPPYAPDLFLLSTEP